MPSPDAEDAQISVIFATFEKHFLIIIPKRLEDRVNLENDGILHSKLPSGVTKTGS